MSRRHSAEKREINPDPKFGNMVISKFMNAIMYAGKKSVAESIVYGALDIIEGKTKQNPLSVFEQAIIETGNDVDVRARALFPGGVLIRRGDAAGTAGLVEARTAVLYQPVFETDRYTTACDILVWNDASGAYDLYEVKASTSGEDRKAKDDLYAHDIAFQALVLRVNGVPLGRLHLVRLNGDYVSDGTLDIDRLFTREDFTDRATPLFDAVAAEMDAAHDLIQLPALPAPPEDSPLIGHWLTIITDANGNKRAQGVSFRADGTYTIIAANGSGGTVQVEGQWSITNGELTTVSQTQQRSVRTVKFLDDTTVQLRDEANNQGLVYTRSDD